MAVVIPAPSAKGPRRQFKIERLLFSRFSCDIFQSRRGAGRRVIRQESTIPFLLRFCIYSRDISSRIILLRSTAIGFRVRDRRRLFPGEGFRFNEKGFTKMKNVSLFSLPILLFTVIHLTSFCFIRTFTISLEISYGPMGVVDLFPVNIDRIEYISSVVVFNYLFNNINDYIICIHLFSTILTSWNIYEIIIDIFNYHHLSLYLIRIGGVNIK